MNQQLHFTPHVMVRQHNMATIYRGTDELSGQFVYVAQLNRALLANRAVLNALRSELPLGQNADPSLLSILDYDLDSQTPFIMVESLSGYPLRQLVTTAGKGLPPPIALICCKSAAHCIDAIHGRGSVHGALNMDRFVIRTGMMVVLTDLIAQIFGTDLFTAGDGPEPTQDHFDYIAPELKDNGRDIRAGTTVSVDIFSLGVLLYHLLTGVAPGVSPSPERPSPWIGGGHTPPLDESIADAVLRARLQKFIQVATARDPLRRWPDINSFIAALDQIAPDGTDSTSLPSPGPSPAIQARPDMAGQQISRRPPSPLSSQPGPTSPRDAVATSPAQTAYASLEVVSSGTSYRVAAPKVSVGYVRSSGFVPDINLAKEESSLACYVSQHHMDLLYEQGRWFIQPYLAARNPTFLDGQQLEKGLRYPLREGAEIDAPALKLVFKLGGEG